MADILKVLADYDEFGPANAGTEITWITPATSDVLYIQNTTSKGFYLLVDNESDTNTPLLTFATPGTASDIEVPIDDYTYTSATESFRQLGPFMPSSYFNTASDDAVQGNSVKCTISGTLTTGELKIAIIKVP